MIEMGRVRKIKKARLSITVLLLVGISSFISGNAFASTLFEQSAGPIIGCYSRNEFMKAVSEQTNAPPNIPMYKIWRMQTRIKGCFFIRTGEMALMNPDLQNENDLTSNIIRLETRSGRSFFSYAAAWHYAGREPDFVK